MTFDREHTPEIGDPAPCAQRVVLFDGQCQLCSGWVRFLLRRDRAGALRFASLQSAAGHGILDRHGLDPEQRSTVVYVAGGVAHLRSDAVLELLRALPWPWRALGALRIVPRPLRDGVYGFVARHRYRWFGRRESCEPPAPEWRERFLD